MRRFEAAQKRVERESKKRQKELERRQKEQAKLSAIEQARLEVETHENIFDVLLSGSQRAKPARRLAQAHLSLPPHLPPRQTRNESLPPYLTASSCQTINLKRRWMLRLQSAKSMDQRQHETARVEYEKDFAQWQKMSSLGEQRILAGGAITLSTEAVSESFGFPFEISTLGSAIHIIVHNPKLVECVLKVNKRDIIPTENENRLLPQEKFPSKKPIPKPRLNEIYKDYKCSEAGPSRLAREILALLPVDVGAH